VGALLALAMLYGLRRFSRGTGQPQGDRRAANAGPAAAPGGSTASAVVGNLSREDAGPASRLLPPRETTTRTAVPARFSDVAAARRLQFTYFADAREDRCLLPETMGGGAAWIDFDGDGRLDLFLSNGCVLPPGRSDRSHTQQLYRQAATGEFHAVGGLAGIDHVLYGQGVAGGDLDNDGFPDLLVTAYGRCRLWCNNADGTFFQRAEASALMHDGYSTSAAMGDIDRDGDLDIYVAHYAEISLEKNPACYYTGPAGKVRGYCGPDHYASEPDRLLRNDDGLRFSDANTTLGPVMWGKGLGVVFADLDNDGWSDIYVANDMGANLVFRNRRAGGTFEDVGLTSGAALSGDGTPEASMGVACADFDGDHDLDLFLTHYYQQKNTYYANCGSMRFDDHSWISGLAAPSLPYLGFGTCAIDYDLDGWQDLFVTNGHVLGAQVRPWGMLPQLFHNQGQGRFVEAKLVIGSYFREQWVGRGAAAADFDNDGDEDLAVVHLGDRPAALLRNDSARRGAPVGFELVGTSSSRGAIGARMRVHGSDRIRTRERIGGTSYLSTHDARILVGLPLGQTTVTVEVQWPSGRQERWESLAVRRYWRLCEGRTPRPVEHDGAGATQAPN
jgi:hypothetical protein